MITLLRAPDSWHASDTFAMSSRTRSYAPDRSAPILITMSTSVAPSRMTRRASKALISDGVEPRGNPTTEATFTSVPCRFALHRFAQNGLTHTAANPYSACLLYTSDAADDLTRVDLGGSR